MRLRKQLFGCLSKFQYLIFIRFSFILAFNTEDNKDIVLTTCCTYKLVTYNRKLKHSFHLTIFVKFSSTNWNNSFYKCFRQSISLTVCSYHVTYAFQSESKLYSCLNVKELFAQNRRKIWSLNDCNGTRTHDHVVRKRTLNHLAKLVVGSSSSSPVAVNFLVYREKWWKHFKLNIFHLKTNLSRSTAPSYVK